MPTREHVKIAPGRRNGGELFTAYPLTSSSQLGLLSLSSPTDSKPQSCQRKPLNHSQLLAGKMTLPFGNFHPSFGKGCDIEI